MVTLRSPRGLHELAGMVWPLACAGCGCPDQRLCPQCRVRLSGRVHQVPVPDLDPALPPVWAASPYTGVAARVIVGWKERGRHQLGVELAAALAPVLVGCRTTERDPGSPRESSWLVVPVPTTAANRRRRGADLVADLAARAARAAPSAGWPGEPPQALPALRHVRPVEDQSALGAARRRRNLQGALSVPARIRPAVHGRRTLVVDDIVTTGATAGEATRALTSAGARVVGVCCLCVTVRRLGVPDVAMLV